MTVRVLPVEILAAEPTVDLHVGLPERGAPVRGPGRLEAAEDRVELGVAHAETVVVALEGMPVREVEGERLVDIDRREGALCLPPGNAEQPGERAGRRDRVARRNDQM